VQEPEHAPAAARVNPISRASLSRLSGAYWWVVGIGAVFTLARFSESFLVLRAQQGGLPLVLIVLNLVFSLGAYPLGRLSDAVSRTKVLIAGLLVLIAADGLLAWSDHGAVFWAGVALWGLHMALTQGLLATLVANAAPADLSGTAYGMFNLVCGVALLVASGLAGWLWDRLGAPSTFIAGMGLACCGSWPSHGAAVPAAWLHDPPGRPGAQTICSGITTCTPGFAASAACSKCCAMRAAGTTR
jgi:predicted MFS family arabinose efflux permease